MSVQEIIFELRKLGPGDFRLVQEKMRELEAALHQPKTALGKALSEVAGMADDLPADLSVNHDHYLFGTRKPITPLDTYSPTAAEVVPIR